MLLSDKLLARVGELQLRTGNVDLGDQSCVQPLLRILGYLLGDGDGLILHLQQVLGSYDVEIGLGHLLDQPLLALELLQFR